jgi:hypothetical protein
MPQQYITYNVVVYTLCCLLTGLSNCMQHSKLKIVHLINPKELDKPEVMPCSLKLNVSTVFFHEEHSEIILRVTVQKGICNCMKSTVIKSQYFHLANLAACVIYCLFFYYFFNAEI